MVSTKKTKKKISSIFNKKSSKAAQTILEEANTVEEATNKSTDPKSSDHYENKVETKSFVSILVAVSKETREEVAQLKPKKKKKKNKKKSREGGGGEEEATPKDDAEDRDAAEEHSADEKSKDEEGKDDEPAEEKAKEPKPASNKTEAVVEEKPAQEEPKPIERETVAVEEKQLFATEESTEVHLETTSAVLVEDKAAADNEEEAPATVVEITKSEEEATDVIKNEEEASAPARRRLDENAVVNEDVPVQENIEDNTTPPSLMATGITAFADVISDPLGAFEEDAEPVAVARDKPEETNTVAKAEAESAVDTTIELVVNESSNTGTEKSGEEVNATGIEEKTGDNAFNCQQDCFATNCTLQDVQEIGVTAAASTAACLAPITGLFGDQSPSADAATKEAVPAVKGKEVEAPKDKQENEGTPERELAADEPKSYAAIELASEKKSEETEETEPVATKEELEPVTATEGEPAATKEPEPVAEPASEKFTDEAPLISTNRKEKDSTKKCAHNEGEIEAAKEPSTASARVTAAARFQARVRNKGRDRVCTLEHVAEEPKIKEKRRTATSRVRARCKARARARAAAAKNEEEIPSLTDENDEDIKKDVVLSAKEAKEKGYHWAIDCADQNICTLRFGAASAAASVDALTKTVGNSFPGSRTSADEEVVADTTEADQEAKMEAPAVDAAPINGLIGNEPPSDTEKSSEERAEATAIKEDSCSTGKSTDCSFQSVDCNICTLQDVQEFGVTAPIAGMIRSSFSSAEEKNVESDAAVAVTEAEAEDSNANEPKSKKELKPASEDNVPKPETVAVEEKPLGATNEEVSNTESSSDEAEVADVMEKASTNETDCFAQSVYCNMCTLQNVQDVGVTATASTAACVAPITGLIQASFSSTEEKNVESDATVAVTEASAEATKGEKPSSKDTETETETETVAVEEKQLAATENDPSNTESSSEGAEATGIEEKTQNSTKDNTPPSLIASCFTAFTDRLADPFPCTSAYEEEAEPIAAATDTSKDNKTEAEAEAETAPVDLIGNVPYNISTEKSSEEDEDEAAAAVKKKASADQTDCNFAQQSVNCKIPEDSDGDPVSDAHDIAAKTDLNDADNSPGSMADNSQDDQKEYAIVAEEPKAQKKRTKRRKASAKDAKKDEESHSPTNEDKNYDRKYHWKIDCADQNICTLRFGAASAAASVDALTKMVGNFFPGSRTSANEEVVADTTEADQEAKMEALAVDAAPINGLIGNEPPSDTEKSSEERAEATAIKEDSCSTGKSTDCSFQSVDCNICTLQDVQEFGVTATASAAACIAPIAGMIRSSFSSAEEKSVESDAAVAVTEAEDSNANEPKSKKELKPASEDNVPKPETVAVEEKPLGATNEELSNTESSSDEAEVADVMKKASTNETDCFAQSVDCNMCTLQNVQDFGVTATASTAACVAPITGLIQASFSSIEEKNVESDAAVSVTEASAEATKGEQPSSKDTETETETVAVEEKLLGATNEDPLHKGAEATGIEEKTQEKAKVYEDEAEPVLVATDKSEDIKTVPVAETAPDSITVDLIGNDPSDTEKSSEVEEAKAVAAAKEKSSADQTDCNFAQQSVDCNIPEAEAEEVGDPNNKTEKNESNNTLEREAAEEPAAAEAETEKNKAEPADQEGTIDDESTDLEKQIGTSKEDTNNDGLQDGEEDVGTNRVESNAEEVEEEDVGTNTEGDEANDEDEVTSRPSPTVPNEAPIADSDEKSISDAHDIAAKTDLNDADSSPDSFADDYQDGQIDDGMPKATGAGPKVDSEDDMQEQATTDNGTEKASEEEESSPVDTAPNETIPEGLDSDIGGASDLKEAAAGADPEMAKKTSQAFADEDGDSLSDHPHTPLGAIDATHTKASSIETTCLLKLYF